MGRPLGSVNKNTILDAVSRLIAQTGINQISLRDIAKETKLSPGTLYYYYATKDELVFDIISKHIDELKNDYVSWLSRHHHDLTSDRFLEVIFFKGVKLFNRARMHIFIINQCMSDNEVLKLRFQEKYTEWRQALKQGVVSIFPNHDDPEAFANLLMTIIDGLVVQEVLALPTVDQSRLIKLVKRMGALPDDQ